MEQLKSSEWGPYYLMRIRWILYAKPLCVLSHLLGLRIAGGFFTNWAMR